MATTKTTKTTEKKPATASYTALADGRVAGQRVKKGDKIDLTPAQAKYENVTPTVEGATKKG